jgi:hypothetical protein
MGDTPSDPTLDWELKLASVKADLPRLREAMEVVRGQYLDYAAQYKAYFDALLEQKFTPEQALAIVCAHGWLPR